MSSLEKRLTRLERTARRARTSPVTDEEIISSLATWNWDGRHLDGLFRVVEPGVLGVLVVWSVLLRRVLLEGTPELGLYSPTTAMCWLLACGQDIPFPREHHLEDWKHWFLQPIGDERRRRLDSGIDRIMAAEAGIVKRLVLKHGLGRLQQWVRLIVGAPEDQIQALLDKVIPRVEPSRWRRMVTMIQPLHGVPMGESLPLLVLSADAGDFLYVDKHGHERTLPREFDAR